MNAFDQALVRSLGTELPLLSRAPDSALFRDGATAMTARQFLADAQRCAATLPPAAFAVNGCADRYWFAVGFAACLLRGQVTLLVSDQTEHGLATLASRYPGLYRITDGGCARTALPEHTLDRADSGTASGTGAAPGQPPLIAARQPAIIAFTSGSTGEPVGTEKTFGELVARSEAAAERFGLTEQASFAVIGTVPVSHMYGFETTLLLPLHTPVASWRGVVTYPADLAAALRAMPARPLLVTTPLQLRAMLETRTAHPPATVISATAPLDNRLAEQAERLWGATVLEIFGASEVGSIASRRTVSEETWTLYPGVTLASAAPAVVSAPGAPDRTLNDVLEKLPGGAFRLLGRASDIVKLGGRRASLAGLTRLLLSVEGVTDGVFFAPDDLETRPTARLAALVVCPDRQPAAVLDALRDRIDPVFLPRKLVCVPALPRSPLGKLPRQALLDLLAAHGGTRAGG